MTNQPTVCCVGMLCVATIAFCYWECARATYKPGRTDSAARRKANTPSLSRFGTFWFGMYVAAWVLLIGLLLLDDVVKPDEAAFNPFEILGVEVRQTVALRYATRILALCLCPHVCGSVYAYYARAFVPVPAAVD